ncbi:MAG: hypothetical protein DDG60_07610 [Anaerolineae bacterium]|nr:MAG: hypothetical protein DDG60_07610 [Anaerolineae bacterium]
MFHRTKRLLASLIDAKATPPAWMAAMGAVLGLSLASFFLPGGDDLYRYYIPFAQGCLDCGFVPYYARWILFPLMLLPAYPLAWPLWVIFSLLGFVLVVYKMKINPFLFFLSFPLLGQVWLGQIDVIVCAGIAILVLSKNPYWRGGGIVLALTKPQLSFLAIAVAVFDEDRQNIWKISVAPLFVLAASCLFFGLDWPVRWLGNAMQSLPVHAWRLAGLDTWRWGLFLLPLPFFVRGRETRLLTAILVSVLSTPFFGVYSYLLFLMLGVQWWQVVLSYAWLAAYPWQNENAMRLAWILPVVLLLQVLWQAWRKRN